MGKCNKIGLNGENLACEFLVNSGVEILHKNYRYNGKEIDIIALENDIVLFIEVKTRSNYTNGFPEDAVTIKKQNHIKIVAEYFVLNNTQYNKFRYDIISIVLNQFNGTEIFHIKDAFY